MAKVYLITGEEMKSLITSLRLEKVEIEEREKAQKSSPQDIHRHFHYHVVRWAQKMGFDYDDYK